MPSFYAIIPADVRYDKRLSSSAKLMYGEITALCNEKGFCWATNQYFADLYEVSAKAISRWISELCNAGYISNDVDKSNKGTERKIAMTIKSTPLDENVLPVGQKGEEGQDKKVIHNSTFNTTSNNTNTDDLPFKSELFKEAWEEWMSYRKQKKLPKYVPMGLKRTFKSLLKDCENIEVVAIEMIHYSISKNWQGLFRNKNAQIMPQNNTYQDQVKKAINSFTPILE